MDISLDGFVGRPGGDPSWLLAASGTVG
jgi:hypothetical protein